MHQPLSTTSPKRNLCSRMLVSKRLTYCLTHLGLSLNNRPFFWSWLVSRFAQDVVKPKVLEMDEKEDLDEVVLKGLFEQGVSHFLFFTLSLFRVPHWSSVHKHFSLLIPFSPVFLILSLWALKQKLSMTVPTAPSLLLSSPLKSWPRSIPPSVLSVTCRYVLKAFHLCYFARHRD